jgi:hypothetical protein
VFTPIVYVLTTGCAVRHLPGELLLGDSSDAAIASWNICSYVVDEEAVGVPSESDATMGRVTPSWAPGSVVMPGMMGSCRLGEQPGARA